MGTPAAALATARAPRRARTASSSDLDARLSLVLTVSAYLMVLADMAALLHIRIVNASIWMHQSLITCYKYVK
jgi:hypothetical protein